MVPGARSIVRQVGVALLLGLLWLHPAPAPAQTLPQAFVNTDTMPTVNGSTFTVNAGGNVQNAINNAAAADGNLTHEVVIQAGATFNTNLTLPAKNGPNPNGTGWIIVRTSNLAGIAVQKQRIIQATHASAMPKIQTTATYGVESAPTAHHFRFIGIEFIRTGGGAAGVGILIWNAAVGNSAPTDIIIDRSVIRQTVDTNKSVVLQGTRVALIDSVVINATRNAGDSNAVWVLDGPGPVKITNNYLEGGGEIMFMGSADYISNQRYQDVEVRRNLLRGNGTTAQKNMIEWKGGLRIWVAANIF